MEGVNPWPFGACQLEPEPGPRLWAVILQVPGTRLGISPIPCLVLPAHHSACLWAPSAWCALQ